MGSCLMIEVAVVLLELQAEVIFQLPEKNPFDEM
jgi:hypothetical protein